MNGLRLLRHAGKNLFRQLRRCCLIGWVVLGAGMTWADETPYHYTQLLGPETDADGNFYLISRVYPKTSADSYDEVLQLLVGEADVTPQILNLELSNVPITSTDSIPIQITGKGPGTYDYTMVAVIYGTAGYYQTIDTWSVTVAEPPPVPSSVSVSPASTSSGNHTVSWSASSGATEYILEQKKGSGDWTEKYAGSGTSKALSGLTVGTYTYRVKACKTVGDSDVCSGYKTSSEASITAPPAPSGFTVPAAVVYGQPIPLSWNAVSGATSYTLIRHDLNNTNVSPQLIYGGTGTSHADSDTTNAYNFGGALPLGEYGYTLIVSTAVGTSAEASASTIVTVPPGKPSAITVPSSTNYSGSYTVSWSSVSSADQYQLEQQTGSGSWVNTYSGTATSKAFSGVAINSYTYRVRACRIEGDVTLCSDWRTSDALSVAKPATPGTFTVPASDNNGAYTVSWSASTGAAHYDLQRRTNGGSWSTILNNTTATSRAESGLGNASYDYRVRSCSGTGCSAYTAVKTTDVAITPGVPSSISSPTTSHSGAYTVSWGTASGSITKYDLNKRLNGGSWSSGYDGTATSKAFSGQAAGTHEYAVRACKTTGSYTSCSAWKYSGDTVVSAPATPAPNAPTSDNNGAYTVSWGSVTGATHYDLQRQTDGGSWSTIANDTTDTSRAESGLGNATYGYRVRACSAVGCSSYSAVDSTDVAITPGVPASIVTPGTQTHSSTHAISWGTASGSVTQYQLYRQIDGGSWGLQYTGTNTAYTTDSLDVGSYVYRVRACKTTGSYTSCSGYRTSGSSSVIPAVPGGFTVPANDNNGAYSVSWNTVSQATSYQLQRRTDGGSWSTLQDTTAASRAESGLGNASYDYRVRACSGTGCSAYTAVKTTDVAITPGVPSSISSPATSHSGAYTVSWGTASGSITKYDLNKRLNGGSWSSGYDGTATSKAFSGQAVGTHEYAVRACKTTGSYTSCSAWKYSGDTVVSAPATPAPNAPTSDNNGAYTVSWGSVTGATHYDLQRQTDGGSWSTIANDTTDTSRAESGLANATYGYRVRACSAVGCSSYSAVDSTDVAITPGAPASITTPGTSYSGDHTVSWGAASGSITTYDLNKRVNGGSWTSDYDGLNLSNAYTGLSAGTYEYQVRACKTTGSYTSCSAYVQTGVATVATPAVPGALDAPGSDNNGAYAVTWGSVTGAATYELQRRVNSGSWSTVQNTSATSASESGLGDGTYDYRVRACSAVGCSAYTATDSTVVQHPPGAPGAVTISGDGRDGAYIVTWGSASGAVDNYVLEEQLGSGSWAQVYSGSNLSASYVGKAVGNYTYRAKACNTAGCSSETATVSVTVEAGQPPAAAPAIHVEDTPSKTSAEVLETDSVGTTAGSFRVDESGSATYNIPIATAAGTAGVAPQLSLNY